MTPESADALALQIGAELQAARLRAGLRLDDLAEDTGLSPASLSLYLRMKRMMPMSAFLLTCKALDQEPADVIARATRAVTIRR